MMTSLDQTLARQHNVAARDQLLAAGINDMTMCRRARQRDWQRLLPAIYALTSEPITTEQRRVAGALYAGDGAQMTGLTALHWYGLRGAPVTEKVHLLVPHSTRRRSVGFVQMQRTHALDEKPRDAELYSLVSPARAIVDACRASGDLTTARAIMTEGVARNIVSVADLDEEVRRAKRSRTAVPRRVLTEILAGIRSAPEAELRDVTATSSTIPLILWNPHLTGMDGVDLPTPDGYIPDAGIALEVDSTQHHAGADDWARTLRRHNILTALGMLVLHFTPKEIRAERRRVLRVIEQAYVTRMLNPPTLAVLIGAPCNTESVNRVPLL